MKLKNNWGLFIFIIIILLGIIISFNIDFIQKFLEKNISTYNYFGIFFFSFLADFISQPIGPEVPGSIALIFNLNFNYTFLFVLIGSYLGSFISYFIGKNLLHSKISIFYKKKSREKYYKIFRKHGKFGLLLASISPVPYVPFCWLAGAFKIRIIDFIIFGLIPRTIRIWIVLFLINLV